MHNEVHQKIANFFCAYPVRTFEKRQVIIAAQETPREVFYIAVGRVSQYDISANGNEIVVNVFKPGAFLPMSSALNDVPNHYFFEASTKTVAHAAPTADAVQFLKDNPDVAFDLLTRVYRGIDGILRRMAHLMGGDAKTRLLFELLNAAYRFGEQQPDGSVLITLNEGSLAKHSGLARETVNRSIQGLKKSGLVRITSGGISIPDPAKLETLLNTTV